MKCDACQIDVKDNDWMHFKEDNKKRCMPCVRKYMIEFWKARGKLSYLDALEEKGKPGQLELFKNDA
jgi:hypothetical protein